MSYDSLVRVAEILVEDLRRDTLCSMSCVNRVFQHAATRVLYRSVILSPPASQLQVLDLKTRNQALSAQFSSSRLPHHAPYVLQLEISGFLSTRPYPLNNFSEILERAIREWTNLQAVTLVPQIYHQDAFGRALTVLPFCQYLRHLEVNASCCDDTRSTLLAQLVNLEQLLIENPTRAILQVLPAWLSRLRGSIQVFHLKNNCGSVTPGVLKSFLPAISQIRSFGLGLSYSIDNDELFGFLSQLPDLTVLEIRYYTQLRPPSVRPNMTQLRRLVVQHIDTDTRTEANHLGKWIRLLLASSPIESLILVPKREFKGPDISFDGLTRHLGFKHASTLIVLRLDYTFVGVSDVVALCASCSLLQELAIKTREGILDQFNLVTDRCKRLDTAIVWTAHSRRKRVPVTEDIVLKIMRHGECSLRRVSVNGISWEGSWTASNAGETSFAAVRMSP